MVLESFDRPFFFGCYTPLFRPTQYVAEYSRTLGAHTAVSTDSDDANPIARCRAGRPPMQANPISDGATGNLGRVQGDRGCEDWIRNLWSLDCGSLVDRRRGEGQELGERRTRSFGFGRQAVATAQRDRIQMCVSIFFK